MKFILKIVIWYLFGLGLILSVLSSIIMYNIVRWHIMISFIHALYELIYFAKFYYILHDMDKTVPQNNASLNNKLIKLVGIGWVKYCAYNNDIYP